MPAFNAAMGAGSPPSSPADTCWRARPATRYAIIRSMGPWFFAAASGVGLWWAFPHVEPFLIDFGAPRPRLVTIAILAALPVIAALMGLWRFLGIKTITYSISDGQLHTGSGVLSRSTEMLELYRVRDIGEQRPFTLRLLGLGEIVLHTEDRSQPIQRLVGLKGTHRLVQDIRNSIEATRGRRGFIGLE